MPVWWLRGTVRLEIGGFEFIFGGMRKAHCRRWAYAVRHHEWEPEVIRYLGRELRPGDVFADVGAYVGPYALLASRIVGPTGRVIVFEPDRRARRLLDENIRRNRMENIEVHAHAVADYVGPGILRGSGNSISALQPGAGETAVTTLDHFFAEQCIEPDVVKIDIEGAERLALSDGACGRTWRLARCVVVEIHGFLGVELADVAEPAARAAKTGRILDVRFADNYNVAFSEISRSPSYPMV